MSSEEGQVIGMRNILFLVFALLWAGTWAQSDTIELKEAKISDAYLLRFSDTRQTLFLPDSILEKNPHSLTSLLNYHSTIYFKENGAGMVSSPSFRGTTAQHTAVVWNGININSRTSGQTDFNTISTRGFDNITVLSGGGSAAYGSSAIGGSIHLNNDLYFRKNFSNRIDFNYGSFNSYGLNFNSKYSDEQISIRAGFSRNGSDNDYELAETGRKNSNGQYYQNNLSIAAGYKFNRKNILKFYANLFDSERHFSVSTPGATRTRYEDYNTRSLLEWNGFYGKFISKLRLAHLSEQYRYFPTLKSENPDFAQVNSWIVKYDLGYRLNHNIFLNAVLDFTGDEGKGSEIGSQKRRIGSAGLFLKHLLSSEFLYELSLRKEFTNNYESPFLYSAGIKWDATDFYEISFHTSKNFRIPTFNDLYWPGNEGLELDPEISVQAEAGNKIHFRDFSFRVNVYYNSIRDMLRWIPGSGGMWSPENTHRVRIYGLESNLNYKKSFRKNRFELSGNYAYTVSENEETGKQLTYVPFHKATFSAGYSRKRISAYYQLLFNGSVFIGSDNKHELDSYLLSNIGLGYTFGKENSYQIGFQLLNLFDKHYQSTLNRFMPGRNFNVYINLNF